MRVVYVDIHLFNVNNQVILGMVCEFQSIVFFMIEADNFKLFDFCHYHVHLDKNIHYNRVLVSTFMKL